MTYERLKQIVVSYPELSKCPELKVGERCYLGEPPFRTLDGMPGAEASFSEIKVSCNYAISPLSSFAGESLPQADLPCVFRRQLGELGKYTPYGLIVSIPTAIPCRSISELRRVPPHVLGLQREGASGDEGPLRIQDLR